MWTKVLIIFITGTVTVILLDNFMFILKHNNFSSPAKLWFSIEFVQLNNYGFNIKLLERIVNKITVIVLTTNISVSQV